MPHIKHNHIEPELYCLMSILFAFLQIMSFKEFQGSMIMICIGTYKDYETVVCLLFVIL